MGSDEFTTLDTSRQIPLFIKTLNMACLAIGGTNDDSAVETGPMILISHPQWDSNVYKRLKISTYFGYKFPNLPGKSDRLGKTF
jgi:hypothetical protein